MASLTPVATTFLKFPLDIIQEILNLKFLTGKDLKILRLVCTQFNIVIEPNVLSHLLINESTLNPDLCQLEMLAAGRTRATFHARNLAIHFEGVDWSYSWEEGVDKFHSTEDHVEEYLGSALSALHNLDCLSWWMDRDDPPWTRYTIVDSIARLPSLRDIQLFLSHHDSPHLRLDQFSGLTKIFLHGMCEGYLSDIITRLAKVIARSPHITHLEIDLDGLDWGPMGRATPGLHDLLASVPPGMTLKLTHLAMHETCFKIDAFTLPHLRSLISLDLSRLKAPGDMEGFATSWDPRLLDRASNLNRIARISSTVSDIFAALTVEKIYLLHIVVDDINNAVLTYIESYSSMLERLEMPCIRCRSAEESDALAKRFYNSVLPKHAKTIQILKVRPAFEGEWCYSSQVAAALSQCQRLASLTIVLPSAVPGKPSSSSVPSDSLYIFDHMVTSIADLSLRLPRLKEVNLKLAKLELYRNDERGSSSRLHDERVGSAMASSAERFKFMNNTCVFLFCSCRVERLCSCPRSAGPPS